MGAIIKKVTKRGWLYFLGAGGIIITLFAKIFFGGAGFINLTKLESSAKNAITQTGIINVANADVPSSGDSGDSTGGDSTSDGGSCDGRDTGNDSCSDSSF